MKTHLDTWFWLYEWPNVRINWRLLFLLTQMTKCGRVCLEMVIKQNFLIHLAGLAQSLTWRLILRKMVTKSTSRYTFYCSHVNLKKTTALWCFYAINKYIACFYHVHNLYSSHHESSSVLLCSVSFDNCDILITMMWNITVKKQSSFQMSCNLTLYPLTLVSLISLLFTIHFPMCWQREFVQ